MFSKYFNGKGKTRKTFGLLLDEDGHLTNRDPEQRYQILSVPQLSTLMTGSGGPQQQDHDCKNDKHTVNPELVGFAAPAGSLWI